MFVRKSDQTCLYEFLWVTSAACPVNVKKDTVFDNCTAVNPQTNVEFDLKALRNTGNDYVVRDGKTNLTYYVNVCGPLVNSRGQFICMLRFNVILGLETFFNITVLADVKIVWNGVTASNLHSFLIRGMESRLLQETNLSWTL